MTNNWYARVLSVDKDKLELVVWLCRWCDDCSLPETRQVFGMLLYEIWREAAGSRLREKALYDPPTSRQRPRPTVPEDLASEWNTPRVSQYVSVVELLRWSGTNQDVDYEDYDNLETEANKLDFYKALHGLQGEYRVRVTHERYLPVHASPDPVLGLFSIYSTAYDDYVDTTEDQLVREGAVHLDRPLVERDMYVALPLVQDQARTDLLGEDSEFVPLEKSLPMLRTLLHANDQEEAPLTELRRIYLAVGPRLPLSNVDWDLMDRVAMRTQGLRYAGRMVTNTLKQQVESIAKVGAAKNPKRTIQQWRQCQEIHAEFHDQLEFSRDIGNPLCWLDSCVEQGATLTDPEEVLRLLSSKE